MKVLFITVALALLSTGTTLRAQNVPGIPPFDQVEAIGLWNKAWYMEIRPDGSGGLGYGSSYGDGASFPKQTFSFKALYDLLVPHLLKEGNIQGAAAVTFRLKGLQPGTPVYALYLYDKSITKKIMSQAIEKSVPLEIKRFNLFGSNSPPLAACSKLAG